MKLEGEDFINVLNCMTRPLRGQCGEPLSKTLVGLADRS